MVRLPPNGSYSERTFSLDVLDTGDDKPLSVNLTTIGAGPWKGLGIALSLVALAGLGLAIWRRARRRTDKVQWLVAVGLVALVAKAIGWGLDGGEAVVLVTGLAVVGFASWLQNKHQESP